MGLWFRGKAPRLQRGDREFESPRVHHVARSPSGKAAVCKAATQGFDSPPRLPRWQGGPTHLTAHSSSGQDARFSAWRSGVRIPYAPQSLRVGRWSSGQDGGLSIRGQGFDSPTPHLHGRLAQSGRAPLLQRGSSGFESLAVHQRAAGAAWLVLRGSEPDTGSRGGL